MVAKADKKQVEKAVNAKAPKPVNGKAAKTANNKASKAGKSGGKKKGKKGWVISGVLVGILLLLAGETYYQVRRQAKLKLDMLRIGRIIPQGRDKGQGTAVVNLEGDKQDNLWFLEGDANVPARLQKFDPQGNSLGVYEPKKPEQLLSNPRDITTDGVGNAYVLMEDHVLIVDKDIKFVGNVRFNLPGAVALGIDSKGVLYIASDPFNKVLMVGRDGKTVGEFGAPGTHTGDLVGPIHMRVSADDQTVILERLPTGLRVKVFSPEHKVSRLFDIKNLQNSVPLKMGLNVDGKLFFNDPTGSRGMVVYDMNTGKYVGDAQATKDGEKFISPGGVGANKWTASAYLHTVPGLIKCVLPGNGDAE